MQLGYLSKLVLNFGSHMIVWQNNVEEVLDNTKVIVKYEKGC
jgi:hypothetical protein